MPVFKFSHRPRTVASGGFVLLEAVPPDGSTYNYEWVADAGEFFRTTDTDRASGLGTGAAGNDLASIVWRAPSDESVLDIELTVTSGTGRTARQEAQHRFEVEVTSNPVPEVLLRGFEQGFGRIADRSVRLASQVGDPTPDQVLWTAIRSGATAMEFGRYQRFIDAVLCETDPLTGTSAEIARKQALRDRLDRVPRPFRGVDSYLLLKTATEAFVLLNCGVLIRNSDIYQPEAEAARMRNRSAADLDLDSVRGLLSQYLGGTNRLPYIQRVVDAIASAAEVNLPFCAGLLRTAADEPCLLELIWSYWHEEGMLVQTLNAVSLRFQNKRIGARRDPLAQLEIDPLRPLNNLLWGYIQDEQNRLTVSRRAYEYDHHYGLTLVGRAVPLLKAADTRSKFLEAFHTLLNRAAIFYQEAADSTVTPDGFALLNALKEVHLILAEGAHNQFGDLPWTARVEMLIQQWLLARPEIREFLRGRAMVPYQEPWMGQVDTMKKLQGWTDTGITHFRDLGVFGEQILLSVRYGDWIAINDENSAKNWATYFRPEIQSYIHSYRAATGVDLTNPDNVDAKMPSLHLSRRLPTKISAS